MIQPPGCILYTKDPDFVRRTRAYLRTVAPVRHVAQVERLDAVLEQNRPAVLMLDLREKESGELLAEMQTQRRDVLIVGFGIARSEPLRDASDAGIYATEDINLDRLRFQSLLGRALDHSRVLHENRVVHEESARAPLALGNSFWNRHQV